MHPLTPADSRRIIFASIGERDWQTHVRGWADFGGFEVYAVYDSRRSPAGWPDLCLVHPRRKLLAFLELKTETGRLKPEQRHWQDVLGCMRGPSIIVAVWRPHQADAVRVWLLGLPGAAPPPSLPEPESAVRVRRRAPRRFSISA